METLKEDLDSAIEPFRDCIKTWKIEANKDSREVTIVIEGIQGKTGQKIIDIRALKAIRKNPEANKDFLDQLSRFLVYFADRPVRRKSRRRPASS